MNTDKFEVGGCYTATPAQQELGQIIVSVIQRRRNAVTFAVVGIARTVEVTPFDGREFVQLELPDGNTYTTSSSVPVDVGQAVHTAAALKRGANLMQALPRLARRARFFLAGVHNA